MRNYREVKIKRLSEKAVMPFYAKKGDSGFDLRAVEQIQINPRDFALIKTGLSFQLPEGYELQVRSRSGLGSKGLQAHFGTVDNGYRGEVGVILYNHTNRVFTVEEGDRIAQAVIQEVQEFDLVEVEELNETERGESGYGSTGVK